MLELFVIQFDNTVSFNMHSEYMFPCLCVPFQANARLKNTIGNAKKKTRQERGDNYTQFWEERKTKADSMPMIAATFQLEWILQHVTNNETKNLNINKKKNDKTTEYEQRR